MHGDANPPCITLMQRGTSLLPALVLACLAFAPLPSAQAADATNAPAPGKERVLFDGKSLQGWTVTDFAGRGEVSVEKGLLVINQGYMTGVHWTNNPPKTNYELSLEARRVSGNDFFCGLTFPIAGTNASLIVGGWGGGVVGISSIDGNDASSNETTKFMAFEKDRWYAIRLRVTPKRLEAWIDKEKVVDIEIQGKNFSLRSGPIEESAPLGIATYETQAHLRNIKLTEWPTP